MRTKGGIQVTFALVMLLGLMLSSAYLFHQWFTDELRGDSP
jgi:hypothetical protein